MTAAPVLNRVSGGDGLYAFSTTGDAGVTPYWAGYIPHGALSDPATLDEVWRDVGGAYVFAAATPASYPMFAAGLATLLAQRPNLRFAWVANPDDPAAYWQVQSLAATATTTGDTIAWTVSQDASVTLGGYSIWISHGTSLTPGDGGPLGWGAALDAAGVAFGAPDGTLYPANANATGVPFAGTALGCIVAGVTLSNDGPDDMERLAVGLRYATPDPDDSTAVVAVPMPLLAQQGATLPVYLTYDPLNPQVPDRSSLAFFAPGSPDQPSLAAAWTTPLGTATTLTPLRAVAPLWSGRLAWAVTPRAAATADDPDYYLTPDGAFTVALAAPGGGPPHLALGVSGIEYVDLGAGPAVALFESGHPAYAPRAKDEPLLTALGTTAYVAFAPSPAPAGQAPVETSGLTYYAQPWHAPLYVAGGDQFLRFHPMPAATLGAFGSKSPPVFLPVAAYSRVDPSVAETAATIERAAIAPVRRSAVPLRTGTAAGAITGATTSDPLPLAVTPNGMLARLSPDGESWAEVVLANLPAARIQEVALTLVGAKLQRVLQSSEVFTVVTNVAEFFAQSSVRYCVDQVTIELLHALKVPQPVIDAVVKAAGSGTCETEQAFRDAVATAAGTYLEDVLASAGQLKASLQDWTFQLSPRSWRTDPATRTVMILKFGTGTLAARVEDPGAWSWPEAAYDEGGTSTAPTQAVIQSVIRDAEARAKTDPVGPYALFLDEVVTNPAWNGVLFLNAPVSIAELPADLQFITAGIDPATFYAHHVGFSLTSFDVDGTKLTLRQTAAFGLITYDDPADLYVDPTTPIDYAFKTQHLSARFANAALADFSARVELMTNRFFGSELTKREPTSGNNLVLLGSYQKQAGSPSYSFTLTGLNDFIAARSVLLGIEVLGVQIHTRARPAGQETLVVDFVLTGNLRFAELAHIDLFSYGPDAALAPDGAAPPDGWLRFGNLVVTMTFPVAEPGVQSFVAVYERMSFDLKPPTSHARAHSLALNFPVTVVGVVGDPTTPPQGSTGQTPEDLGYTAVLSALDTALLSPPWFGLVLEADLGTVGALAGSAGMKATLLAGWAPGARDGDAPVFLGFRLGSADATTALWQLQGVLKLGFRGFELLAVDDATKNTRAYMLRLQHLALSILALSFPPGELDVLVFGDPGGASTAVGWYASYDPTAAKPAVPATTRRLAAGRRELPQGSGWER